MYNEAPRRGGIGARIRSLNIPDIKDTLVGVPWRCGPDIFHLYCPFGLLEEIYTVPYLCCSMGR
jgi:hypothetical protein